MGNSAAIAVLAGLMALGGESLAAGRTIPVPEGYFVPPFPGKVDADEGTKIRVPAFRLDAAPVSVAEYLSFLGARPEWRKSRVKPLFADTAYLRSWSSDFAPPPGDPSRPVTQVSWFAAKAFCESEGKRLPGTREWERVAQALPEGEDSAGYAAREFGKIWEWTSDFNREGPAEALSGDRNNSFFCGGAAGSARPSGVDYATYMRFAFRSSLKPEYSTSFLGFRCAAEASP